MSLNHPRPGGAERVLSTAWRPALVALATAGLTALVGRLFWGVMVQAWAAVSSAGPDSPSDLLVGGLAGLGLLLTTWFGLGMATAALAALPGALGRAAERVARRVAPSSARRATAFLLGTALTVAMGPGSAAAADGGNAAPGFRTTISVMAGSGLTGSGVSAPAGPRTTPPTPAPDPAFGPTGPTVPAGAAAGGAAGTASLRPDASGPSPLLGGTRRTAAVSDERVVVQRGDTLWSIAARHLRPGAGNGEVTREWHRWYAANLAVIGDDPDVIRPGQLLNPPAGTAQ